MNYVRSRCLVKCYPTSIRDLLHRGRRKYKRKRKIGFELWGSSNAQTLVGSPAFVEEEGLPSAYRRPEEWVVALGGLNTRTWVVSPGRLRLESGPETPLKPPFHPDLHLPGGVNPKPLNQETKQNYTCILLRKRVPSDDHGCKPSLVRFR